MHLRPHHLLDIVTEYGAGTTFEPHPYGHAVHTCAEVVLNDLDTEVQFVVAADFICAPCVHLVDGVCDDVVDLSAASWPICRCRKETRSPSANSCRSSAGGFPVCRRSALIRAVP